MRIKSTYLKLINYYELSLYILALICFIYSFGNGYKMFYAISIIFVLLGFRLIIRLTHIEIHPILKTSILTFIFMAMFLAAELHFYRLFPGFDKLLHSLSGILFFFVGLTIFKHINRSEANLQVNLLTVILFSLFFSISVAGCWEIFEFSLDRIFGCHSQHGSLFDTMGDIICGTTGALLTAIYVTIRVKRDNFSHILKFVQTQTVENQPYNSVKNTDTSI